MRSVSVGRSPAMTSSSSRSLRVGRERARDLEPLAVGQGQADAGCARLSKRSSRRSTSCASPRAASSIGPPQQRADDDIVLDRKRRKRPHQLEGAPDAAPADRVGARPSIRSPRT